ncbi:diphosphomevalonate decarboxylase [Mangrovimonas yunxiaonensis]|uniref:Diphosphomevalonate decarboxylase n=1 Tax=Mangrovimonas yunxiaonensis TaxID=1197477 RepID=A0A084TLL9_9FLAO|nr:diphosphomevalonate decarboxylase [Mangrovimonas yunxiaonensis]KFB01605.1 diphosphomevalonate decarboxylase [Mangrovimonas yunxiaonensis]GGH35696.1 diphosphomevalonate decarboxylase [Mangrovimonas yunxiaonensis]
MTEQDFIPKGYSELIDSGTVTWESPSNIALIKYWGKRDQQIPENPSISFTLSACKTITTVDYEKKATAEDFSFEVFLNDEKKADFKPKIETFFKRIEGYVPFLKHYHFTIKTQNTFPHSSGIASSASGMSALALCLMSIEKALSNIQDESEAASEYFNRKASFLARLGSGSACRSVAGDLVVWGQTQSIAGSSNLFGVKYPYSVHKNFKEYQDTILLIDKGEKQVSSTLGHELMYGHPYAEARFSQAHDHMEMLKTILKTGDLQAFIDLIESEALTLHAMMMTSNPYFILMKPHTLEVINLIWKFREETGLHVGFTLDAGANVHVLYPKAEKDLVLEFIEAELAAYCKDEAYICDTVGLGAQQVNP